MREQIEARLKQIETNLAIYNRYVNNPAQSQANKQVVSFKLLFEMMAFSALHALVPDYVPSAETLITVSTHLGGTANLVDVVNGEVVISTAYQDLLSQQAAYTKQHNNGKVDQG